MSSQNIDELCINTIRTLSMDAVQKANSGHPGAPMGLAPAAYVMWTRHLRHNPKNPDWFNRDRFILSNGHASMLLYSLLHLTGYESMTLDQIENFRQWGSITPGHPEVHMTPGVETTTGPLGQGLSTAIGMAIAEEQLNQRYDGLVDHYTLGICSDGDIMEGVTHEACALAGHLGLGKLIFLYDDNSITIDGRTDLTFTEDVLQRYEAYGWHVDRVEDGNDIEGIDRAITMAKAVEDKPSLISVQTIIGYGSPNKADKSASHGAPLGEDEVALSKETLGWEFDDPFHVPSDVRAHMDATEEGEKLEAEWNGRMEVYAEEAPEKHSELTRRIERRLPEGWDEDLPTFEPDETGMATRKSGGAVIKELMGRLPELTGGSADLAGSNKTLHEEFGVMEPGHFDAQNMHFGVREHGMAAIANGMTLHGGVRGFGATFLIFSDYMKPALRIAALSEIPSLFVFTHDSIGLGEDGPTHQPVEQLAQLRATPNFAIMRPGYAEEVTECWRVMMERTEGPSALALTRQNVPTLDRGDFEGDGDATKGAYILADAPSGEPEIILIGTGSEVPVCIEARELLVDEGIEARVVSMPCWQVFEEQDDAWKERVLPSNVKARVAVEAAAKFGWERWVGIDGDIVALDQFGHSAPGAVNFEKYGFTADNVAGRAKKLLDDLKD